METNAALTDAEARAALAQVESGRSAAGRRVVTPWWFHPLLGAAFAAMLASLSLRGPVAVVVLVLSLAAQVALYVVYRRVTGLWVNLWNVDGMRRPTAVATVVAVLGAYLGSWFEHGLEVRGSAAVAGVALGVAYVVFWRWVDRRLAQLWSQRA